MVFNADEIATISDCIKFKIQQEQAKVYMITYHKRRTGSVDVSARHHVMEQTASTNIKSGCTSRNVEGLNPTKIE